MRGYASGVIRDSNRDLRRAVNRAVNKGREQGLEQGRDQGLTQGRSQVLVSLVKDGRLSVEEAAGYSGLSIAEFTKLCSE